MAILVVTLSSVTETTRPVVCSSIVVKIESSGGRGHDEERQPPPPTDRAATAEQSGKRGQRGRRRREGVEHVHDAQRLLVHDRLAPPTGDRHLATVSLNSKPIPLDLVISKAVRLLLIVKGLVNFVSIN